MSKRAIVITAASLLYVFLWSTGFVAIKTGVTYCPPLTLCAVRFLLAAAMMWGLARWLSMPAPIGKKAWIRISMFGTLNVLLPVSCNFVALRYASVGTAAIISATNPLLLAVLAPKLLGESLSARRVVGLLFGFGGVLFVMSARVGGAGKVDSPLGVGLLAFQVVCLVGATIFFKRFPPREPLLIVNAVQLTIAGSFLVLAALITEHPLAAHLNLPLVVSFVHLVLVISIGAALLWFWLLAKGEASVASSYLFLSPLFGLLAAAVLLGEKLTMRDGFGLIAVMAGIVLIRGPSKKK